MAVEKNYVDQKRSVGCNTTNNDARTMCRTHQFGQRMGYKCMYLPFDMKKLALITMKGNGLSIAFGNPKKLALITMKGNGLSIAFSNPKKAMSNSTSPFEGVSSNLDHSMVFPHERRCVALTRLRISGQFLHARQTNFSNRR
jgi:hypothetical protein